MATSNSTPIYTTLTDVTIDPAVLDELGTLLHVVFTQ
jgi:hypothetical protein